MSRPVKSPRSRAWIWLLFVAALLVLVGCIACYIVYQFAQRDVRVDNKVTLEIAHSPEKRALFEELIKRYSAKRPRTPSGKAIELTLRSAEPDAMIEAALAGQFQVICPDSSIWLSQLEKDWQEQTRSETSIVGETTRFALSPLVIAMWEDVARSLGYPAKAIGWADLLSAARNNSDFKWSHPSTSSASGLLATLATFYAGAGKTRGLTVDDVTNENTLAYVAALQKTVRYYGEGELAVIEQVTAKGPDYLDAFVVQEQLLIGFNQSNKGKLIAIYPVEGAMWADHPLVFLERTSTTSEERLAYRSLRDYLLTQEAQMLVLANGYRPSDLSISLTLAASPIHAQYGADASQPKTTLQIPSPSVIQVVRDVWQYAKRKANVYLVADVSGSMQGDKLTQAKEALQTFLGLVQGQQERVGLIVFSSSAREVVPMAELETNLQALQSAIGGLNAGGNTALLDAVDLALRRLQEQDDRERINAVVVMTDGIENASSVQLSSLTSRLSQTSKSGLPVVVFCVAYGSDADMRVLEAMASASGGQTRVGSPTTIRELYRLLSTYF